MTKQCDGRHVTEDLGVASGVGLFVSFVSTCVEPQALKGRRHRLTATVWPAALGAQTTSPMMHVDFVDQASKNPRNLQS